MSEAHKSSPKYGLVSDMPESFVRLMQEHGLAAHAELIFYGIAFGVALALVGLLFWVFSRKRNASLPTPSSLDDFRSAVTSSVDDSTNLQMIVGSATVFDVVETTEINGNGHVVKEVISTVTTLKKEPKSVATPTKRGINTRDLKTPDVSATRVRKAPVLFSPTGDYILTPQSPAKKKSRKSLGEGKN